VADFRAKAHDDNVSSIVVWRQVMHALIGRLDDAESERDALAERVEKLERALGELWALWNDKEVAGWNADYLRGHLSYASMLNERTRNIRETLARPSTPPTDGAV
jgi:hypothetical protein